MMKTMATREGGIATISTASIAKSLLLLFLWHAISVTSAASQSSGIDEGDDGGGAVFTVSSKFAGMDRSLSAMKAHDSLRHLQMLAGVDLPLGGTGRPDACPNHSVNSWSYTLLQRLYYARIGIGTPSRDYYVQVDTGSDIMWVNCIQCTECPKKGYHGLELTLYDPKDSLTGELVSCDQQFCVEISGGPVSDCSANVSCLYTELYGDGSFSLGYFVKDIVQYDRVSGDLQTKSANGSVIFGCGARQSGDLDSSDEALDGILGFGKSNSSMLSQLASTGRVRKMFAHCLDGVNGGGIFAIGHVVEPKVNTTRLVQNTPHYNVNMTAVEVGREFLNLTGDVFEIGNKKGTIIDSGTTLAYLPQVIYEPLVKTILSWQSDLNLRTLHDQYLCFQYSESVDDGFPPVTFHFESSLSLMVYPREYLFPFVMYLLSYRLLFNANSLFAGRLMVFWLAKQRDAIQRYHEHNPFGSQIESDGFELVAVAFEALGVAFVPLGVAFEPIGKVSASSALQELYLALGYSRPSAPRRVRHMPFNTPQSNISVLGSEDLVLSNKLVLYDLENQLIGWTEYNCSSSIQLKDEVTGSVHLVGAHYLSPAWRLSSQWSIIFLLTTTLLHGLVY
ncbi:hypothetical protein RHSIM_Rhsim09G0037000 [Rhododendron simsii]|uniref:Peptidase A1 domain-containing protein n=1 Tax=Rhododendron simsii TaxID=118357 RepID=A0A834GDP5_RHOSS|nr:hypothetical protein RHSIM_Rhsim09G0037000 [Rhododendron simsii]